jgi:hypothetical protein
MKCPYSDGECIHIDTAAMIKTDDCKDCILHDTFINSYLIGLTTEELLDLLPPEIFSKKKKLLKIFNVKEAYTLHIYKGPVIKLWSCEYYNELSCRIYFKIQHANIRTCLRLLVIELFNNGYIQLNIK